ncbi:MAG: hypothetical protein K8I30_24640, partial [Anaerolineae bacterium]|nr:hypothetical protein [Anaerolineae bacterium]
LLDQHPDADFIYSDEDKIEPDGVTHTEPFFKPSWSPRLLLTCNYITHFAVIRRSLVEQVGGFRDAFVGSQDHDLFLRITDHTSRVYHIPKMLYSWRKSATSTADGAEAKSYAVDAALRAVAETVTRRGWNATVERGLYPPFMRVRHAVPVDARVSIIRPLRGVNPMPVLRAAEGDYLLFLPDGVHLPKESITALLEWASQPDVGCVGSKIVTSRGKLIHMGMSVQENVSYPGNGMRDVTQAIFYFDLKDTIREVSAVSWAGMMVSRKKFMRVGGFDQGFSNGLFDVDLCLRLEQIGYANIYTPFSRLVVRQGIVGAHGRVPLRNGDLWRNHISSTEWEYFQAKWGTTLTDHYLNPHLGHPPYG